MYFDYLASTPIEQAVIDAMRLYWNRIFANPHSTDHAEGLAAMKSVETSYKSLNLLLPEKSKGQWVITSGATEANNMALKGIFEFEQCHKMAPRSRILVSAIEHPCVLATARYLEQNHGADLTILPVNNNGELDLPEFEKQINKDVLFVSVMWANNETGVIQPVEEIAKLCKEYDIIFHSDAAQAAGKIDLGDTRNFPDLISISGHKVYGPKGIGALWIADGCKNKITPLIHGGGQQQGLRSGTIPVPLVIGLSKAIEIAEQTRKEQAERLAELRDAFEAGLRSQYEDLRVNGENAPRLPHVSHFQMPGVDMGDLLASLPEISASRGSACSSEDTRTISHVLAAMRMEFFAHECLRISFGRPTTEEDVEILLNKIVQVATKIREKD